MRDRLGDDERTYKIADNEVERNAQECQEEQRQKDADLATTVVQCVYAKC